ncbi:hypothetical protein KKF34_15665 [Myxococcota bacterium]|nr:hypothetical protein [Myxococcota bacterium]MBU1498313.1 hypothetical protein [Myxococcota bacterium]
MAVINPGLTPRADKLSPIEMGLKAGSQGSGTAAGLKYSTSMYNYKTHLGVNDPDFLIS